jgi:hypothetical protein
MDWLICLLIKIALLSPVQKINSTIVGFYLTCGGIYSIRYGLGSPFKVWKLLLNKLAYPFKTGVNNQKALYF